MPRRQSEVRRPVTGRIFCPSSSVKREGARTENTWQRTLLATTRKRGRFLDCVESTPRGEQKEIFLLRILTVAFIEVFAKRPESSTMARLQTSRSEQRRRSSSRRRPLATKVQSAIKRNGEAPHHPPNGRILNGCQIKRKAYGYRDQEFFELKIHHLHRMKHAFLEGAKKSRFRQRLTTDTSRF